MNFNELPHEIINNIADQVESKLDLNSLTRTNSTINDTLNHYPSEVLERIKKLDKKTLLMALLKEVDTRELMTCRFVNPVSDTLSHSPDYSPNMHVDVLTCTQKDIDVFCDNFVTMNNNRKRNTIILEFYMGNSMIKHILLKQSKLEEIDWKPFNNINNITIEDISTFRLGDDVCYYDDYLYDEQVRISMCNDGTPKTSNISAFLVPPELFIKMIKILHSILTKLKQT